MWFLFISIKMNELGLQGGLKHYFFFFRFWSVWTNHGYKYGS